MTGITALKYARDRHSFATEDLARIDNQQRLLASLLNEAVSGGTLANPVRLSHFLTAALAAIRVDNGLNVAALADQMRGISTSKVAFTTVPVADANYTTPDGQSAVQWDSAAASRLFGAIGSDQPLITPPRKAAAKPAPVAVDVYNGTLIGGLSAGTGAQLTQLGFQVRAGLTWPRQNVSQTVIYYRHGQLAAARQVRCGASGRDTQAAFRAGRDQGRARCEREPGRRTVVRGRAGAWPHQGQDGGCRTRAASRRGAVALGGQEQFARAAEAVT